MDPFTHFLLGYLITFGIWGPDQIQYVVAGALAGGLPDADIVFFPLARRFPGLRHRGLSHSIVGVTVIAIVGVFAVPPLLGTVLGPSFASGSPVFFFVALEAGGLSHVLLDSMDHWSIPPFAPFSQREYHLDADRIMNLGAMIFTVASYAALIYEGGRVPRWMWVGTSWLLLAMVVAYFVVRLTGRWRVGVAVRREGFAWVVPQANPFEYLFAEERRTDTSLSLRVARYHLLRGYRRAPRSITIALPSSPSGPVRDRADALARSYGPALEESWVLRETHRFGEAADGEGGYDVFWYSLEFAIFGRAAGVVAHVDAATGAVTVRSKWRVPSAGAL